ncbi:hypothetical protein D3C75_1304620 [compost metagenome]
MQRFFTHQSRRQHGKLTPTDTRHQILGFRVLGTLPGQLLADRPQQLIGALTAQALVQAGQVLDPQ